MNRLAILGASGHGKVVADCAERSGWKEIVFYDDAWSKLKENGVWQVTGTTKELLCNLENYDGVIVAIGDNTIRTKKYKELIEHGARIATIIDPAATVSSYAKISIGAVIFSGAVINIDSYMGIGCIINTGATVDHDCKLGDGVHISPGVNISGGVTIGNLSWIGIGACIRQCTTIGENVIVGAGAVVISDVSDSITVAGVPARQLVKN